MPTSSFFVFALLLLFLFNMSCAAYYPPIEPASYEEEKNLNPEVLRSMLRTENAPIFRLQRSRFDHPRFNRNAWFRVSTYQHMKPNGGSDEKTAGDNLMRWG